MERRLLLVFALTFLVIILLSAVAEEIFAADRRPRRRRRRLRSDFKLNHAARPLQSQPRFRRAGASKQAAAEAETVVENDLYRITFTNRGGLVKSWILKKYDDDHGKPLEMVQRAAREVWLSAVALDIGRGQRNKTEFRALCFFSIRAT